MVWTEINPEGNFEIWDDAKLNEIKQGNFTNTIGEALFENDEIILWEITLEPFERLPIRRHVNNYACTCFTSGLAIVRNINGRINLIGFEKGYHYYLECNDNEIIQDIENIGETRLKIAVVEENVNTIKIAKNKQ